MHSSTLSSTGGSRLRRACNASSEHRGHVWRTVAPRRTTANTNASAYPASIAPPAWRAASRLRGCTGAAASSHRIPRVWPSAQRRDRGGRRLVGRFDTRHPHGVLENFGTTGPRASSSTLIGRRRRVSLRGRGCLTRIGPKSAVFDASSCAEVGVDLSSDPDDRMEPRQCRFRDERPHGWPTG